MEVRTEISETTAELRPMKSAFETNLDEFAAEPSLMNFTAELSLMNSTAMLSPTRGATLQGFYNILRVRIRIPLR